MSFEPNGLLSDSVLSFITPYLTDEQKEKARKEMKWSVTNLNVVKKDYEGCKNILTKLFRAEMDGELFNKMMSDFADQSQKLIDYSKKRKSGKRKRMYTKKKRRI